MKAELTHYLSLCEEFWKNIHDKTYEAKLEELYKVSTEVVRLYSLSGFDAYYTLFIMLKKLRNILPLVQYEEEYTKALQVLENIKVACMAQLRTYIKQK